MTIATTVEPKERISINPPVFLASAVLLVIFLVFAAAQPELASTWFSGLLKWVSTTFGWFYVGSVAFFLLFALWLGLGPHGGLRLGLDDQRPDYSRLSWFAMLFSAGIGIGLVYYGVAEPIMHYSSPPVVEGATALARQQALPLTMLHWGIHGWAVYVLVGASIAYFAYRKGLPLSLRSCLYPILGDRIHGLAGHIVDVIAVFGTLFGLATSLGLGATTVSAGMGMLFGTPHTVTTQLLLIVFITGCATVSLVTGVDKGIKRLSELNLFLAFVLMLFVLVAGPTLAIFETFVQGVGGYMRVILDRTFALAAHRPDSKAWLNTWTVFYWGWWISWAPFVGTFLARISRGRTMREFVLGVLLVPTAVSLVWFSVFGGTALELEAQGAPIAAAVASDVSTAVYVMLQQLPMATITSVLAIVVVTVFFVTSSDSASFVVDMLTSGGHPNPPVWQRIFWAVAEGSCAGVLLFAGGKQALTGLQAMVVSIGLPFCAILLLMAYCMKKSLDAEGKEPAPVIPEA